MGTISQNHFILKFQKIWLVIMLARKLKFLHCHQENGSSDLFQKLVTANLRKFEKCVGDL